MSALIADADLQQRVIAQRQAAGSDRWDEVWDGVYILMPLPNIELQGLVGDLTAILKANIEWPGLGRVFPGVNVSDRIEGWQFNYRCPDVVAFLNDTSAQSHDAFWYGGPDFAIEVVSPNDRTREKLDFYAAVGTRELLLVDREPWSLELFRLAEGTLKSTGRSTIEKSDKLSSDLVPLSFTLEPGQGRPQIHVRHQDGQQSWTV
jgi:Uma2 family endonuclease